MANLELTFNPKKLIRRADLVKMGELITSKAKDKKIDVLMIKITDDMIGGENSVAWPFKIVDEK